MGARAKYDRIRSISTGGSAGVNLCRTVGNEGLEQLVVVKELPPSALGDAQRAARVVHPNLVKVFDVSDDTADAFVAREYLHGEDLEHIAAAAHDNGVPIALDAALALAVAVAAAVAHAHAAGLVHGDIAAGRVMVGYDGNVKLIDLSTPPPPAGATRANDIRAIAALIAEHAIGAPELEAIVARAAADGFADAKSLGDALAAYAATAELAITAAALARLMESLYPGRREDWVKARKQGVFFVEAHVLQQLESQGMPTKPEASIPADEDPTGVTDAATPALPATEITQTKTNTTTHVGVHLAPIEIDLEAGSGGLIAPPLPSPTKIPTPIPGAVPILAAFSTPPPGTLVKPPTRAATAPAVVAAPLVDIDRDDAAPVEILSPAMPGERTERVRVPTPLPERAAIRATPRRRTSTGPVIAVALLAVIAVGIVVFVITRTHDSPAAVANPAKSLAPPAPPTLVEAPPTQPPPAIDDTTPPPPPPHAPTQPPRTPPKKFHTPTKKATDPSQTTRKDDKWSSDSVFLPVH